MPAASPATARAGLAAPTTTAQHALDGLRSAIGSGDLRPGDRVAQEEVALRFGVSIAPVREALRVLEQEGLLTYRPRRGYFVTELKIEDLHEIYELRRLLEERAAREAIKTLGEDDFARIAAAARECEKAAARGDIAAQLEANRRFHFGLLDAPGQPHTLRLIQLLWDSTEAYRAIYYSSPEERGTAVARSHKRILDAARSGDADALVAALDEHRDRALIVLGAILALAARRDAPPWE
jgi:DNA-binding GntR family transcriptional regulator